MLAEHTKTHILRWYERRSDRHAPIHEEDLQDCVVGEDTDLDLSVRREQGERLRVGEPSTRVTAAPAGTRRFLGILTPEVQSFAFVFGQRIILPQALLRHAS
jgi:hypothetical protein